MSIDDISSKDLSADNLLISVPIQLDMEILSEWFDSMGDLIQIVAPDGHFLFVNRDLGLRTLFMST